MAPARSAPLTFTTKTTRSKLLLGEGGHDVPRNHQGIALLGDQRNDVHLFVSQMQVAFIRTHNRIVDRLRADGVDESDLFEETRRTATWHYQWVILTEFLPLLVGHELVDELLDGGWTLLRPEEAPYMPFEFADAAYRYGHSQIRRHLSRQPGFRPGAGVPRPNGFRRRAFGPHHRLDAPVRPARERIRAAVQEDRRHACSLPDRHAAPGHRRGGGLGLLLTCHTRPPARPAVGLASGEAVAREMGVEPLSADQIGLADGGWDYETPLWLYVLKEAEALHDGDRLGPVGGRIVGEVLVGIIDADPESFRSVDPSWRPTLPSHEAGIFGITDLLVSAE